MAFTTKRSLLRGCHDGTPDAWEKFQAFYTPLIVMCGRDYGLSDEEIKDLRQNVLVSAYRNDLAGKYNPGIAHFRTLLRTVIHRKAVDIMRQRMPSYTEIPTDVADSDEDGSSKWDEEWREFILKVANEELRETMSNEKYMAFDLYVNQGMELKDVCEILGMSENQVYIARTRGVKQLKEIVQRLESEENE